MANNIVYLSPYSNELYHHGVLGMKWGVRRYQNADGSLTDKGRKRLHKQLSGKGEINLGSGTTFYRVSRQSKTDATKGRKLYVNANETEHERYKRSIGSSNVVNKGYAYVHKYVAKSDIKIPSMNKQTKMES